MTLTQCLREPLTDTGCICCQGLAGAVAFVFGKCLLTSGVSAKRVFCVKIFCGHSDFYCVESVSVKWLLQAGYIWLNILESLQSEAEDRQECNFFKSLITFQNIHYLIITHLSSLLRNRFYHSYPLLERIKKVLISLLKIIKLKHSFN